MKTLKNQELFDSISELLKEENKDVLKSQIADIHPYDLAQIFPDLTENDRQILYSILDPEILADLFSYLDNEDSAEFLKELTIEDSASVLENMEADDAADVLQEMGKEDMKEFLGHLSEETQSDLSILSSYSDTEIGSIMTTNYIEIESHLDVKQAMKQLISDAHETEVIDPIFVTENQILVGILDLKDLIIARSPKRVDEIMQRNVISANATDDIMDAVNKLKDYSLSTMPILIDGKLIGIVTIDDAIDVFHEDVSYHYEKLAAAENIEEKNFFRVLLKRLPWLIILLLFSLVTSNVIGNFEDVLQQVTVLIFFQTLILDMAGKVGTQSLAVTIRIISRNDLSRFSQIAKHILKELRISIINSIILGILAFSVSILFLLIKNPDIDILAVSFTVAASMSISLIGSGLLGALFPILFHKMHIDSAVASGPFITTFNDIISILIYFSIASALLPIAR